jgi:hypothetical protein
MYCEDWNIWKLQLLLLTSFLVSPVFTQAQTISSVSRSRFPENGVELAPRSGVLDANMESGVLQVILVEGKQMRGGDNRLRYVDTKVGL